MAASTKKKTEDEDKVDTENVTFGRGSGSNTDPITAGGALAGGIGGAFTGAAGTAAGAVSGLLGMGAGGGQTALAKEVTAQSTANAQGIYDQALIDAAIARGYTGPTSVGFAPVEGPNLLLGADYASDADTRAVATDFRNEITGYDAALAQAADASSRIQQANVERVQQQAPAMVRTVDTAIKAPTLGPAAQTGAVGVERVGLPTSADALRSEQIKAARAISGGPLASATQFRASQGQVVADQLAMAERARGAERAGARREAMIAAGQQGISAGLAASALAAQEDQARRTAAASALGGIRSQDVTSATAGAQIAAEQANLQAQLNAAIAQGNTAAVNAIRTRQAELALTARQSQVQAEITEQSTKADIERANLEARQQTAMTNAQAQNLATGNWAAAYNAAVGQNAQNQTAVSLANAASQTQSAQELAAARNAAASTYAQMATGTSQANATLAQKQASENAARALAAETTNQAAVQAARTQTAANQQAAQQANASNQLSTQQLRQSGATSALGAGTAATGVQAGNAQTIVDANKQQATNDANKQNAIVGALATGAAIAASDERVKQDIKPIGDGGKYTASQYDDWAGLYGRGNIALNDRPVVTNPDGSYSTTYSMTTGPVDGKYVLIPGVRRGLDRQMTEEEAVREYRETGERFGEFDSPEDADAYAKKLHEDQSAIYAPIGEHLQKTSDERTKRSVDSMSEEDIQDWALAMSKLPITFRYKPGVEDGGAAPHVGLPAQAVEKTGPLGKIMVQKDPEGVRMVDYGAASLMLSKAAFDKAVQTDMMLRELAGRKGAR